LRHLKRRTRSRIQLTPVEPLSLPSLSLPLVFLLLSFPPCAFRQPQAPKHVSRLPSRPPRSHQPQHSSPELLLLPPPPLDPILTPPPPAPPDPPAWSSIGITCKYRHHVSSPSAGITCLQLFSLCPWHHVSSPSAPGIPQVLSLSSGSPSAPPMPTSSRACAPMAKASKCEPRTDTEPTLLQSDRHKCRRDAGSSASLNPKPST